MSERLGPLLADIAGTRLDAEDREVLCHPLVGGIILFSRNCHDPHQVAALVADIRALRAGLLVTVDQEGGRVQRLRDGFTRLPSARDLGQDYAAEPEAARRRCRVAGWLMAAELRAVDIDLSFAPVLDVDHACSTVIGDRAFAATADAVASLAGAFAAGMAEAGMVATGKHFPGHGGVAEDSHLALPEDGRGRDELGEDERPFRELISRAALGAVMMAHVVYPQVDPAPASLSRRWIGDELRARIGFRGAVVCDDLGMAGAAVAGDMLARARTALAAGCDLLPVCNDRAAVIALLEHLDSAAATAAGSARLQALRAARQPPAGLAALRSTQRWRQVRDTLVTPGR